MATRKKKNNIGAFGHPIYGKGFAKYGEMRPNGSSEIPNDLESYAQKVEDHYDVGEERGYLCVVRGEVKDAVIAGAKWQKEQMMREAVDATVIAMKSGDKYCQAYITDRNSLANMCNGDHVKLIIVKEVK